MADRPAGQRAGAARRWIAFTRALAVYQLLVGLLLVSATILAEPIFGGMAVVTGVIVMPILASLWLVGLLRICYT